MTVRSDFSELAKPDLYYTPTMSMDDFVEVGLFLFSQMLGSFGFIPASFSDDDRRTIGARSRKCRTKGEARHNAEACNKVVHSCPEQVLPIRQVCAKYTLSTDIVLNEYSTKKPYFGSEMTLYYVNIV
ncbi:hypothetical protein [Sphingobacterium pedocola]|uniref:Protein kinase domain-containing protein n=1 Tax=Sphingobacterium pedocola TaxID=2082722 RepID=A0ABR9TAD6_9SPHI|nr:hypothetical protein [Sphingobacterium pedocola]MBE8722293.1 hypothetical protein [Sphingobacterium pedocola]